MDIFKVGDILVDTATLTKYRVIYFHKDSVILCEMEVANLVLLEQALSTIINLITQNQIVVEKPNFTIFDVNTLSDTTKESFLTQKAAMKELVKAYGPTYMELMGKKAKPAAKKIMEKYNIKKATFWNICRRYLQSGLQDIALVDQKAFGNSKGREYDYETRPGRRSEYVEDSGIILTDEIRGYFDEALADLKTGRQKTIRACFDKMNLSHFTRVEVVDGVQTMKLMPITERPTYKQFYNYIHKNLTEQEKDLIKTSAREQRNDKRLIISDSLYGVNGPGDMVEIDACEVDVSLVSQYDNNKTVGRPIVYFMIDVYSRIILAASIAFDNNSNLGLTNLFLNLADNKQEFCQRFGMSFDNPALWPSNIIPKRVRVDHGAEFKGKQFERICDELGIERILVPVATGSMKGIVEQSFRQLHLKQNMHLENHGLIEKRHDSKHHTESSLNIEQYTRMVINFILTHNQQYITSYQPTKDMIVNKIQSIPAVLWEYGIKKYGEPRPITNREQYLFNLMTPVKAKLNKRGIGYKELWYLPDMNEDTKISREMFNAGTKNVPFEVRIDMRDVGAVYYLRDGKLIKAPLNTRLHGNDFGQLTMKEYECLLQMKKAMLAEGKIHNEAVSAFNYAVNEAIVDEAKKRTPSDKKHLRASREQEKQNVSFDNRISKRMPQALPEPEVVEALPEPQPEPAPAKEEKKSYKNFKEALEDMWDNY